MNINEAATILRLNRDEVKIAIKTGITLPISKVLTLLEAHIINDEYDIDEDKLDEFIKAFDAEEPGRHPPTAVCRALLVEARHRCSICEGISPFEFHHIIEFSKLEHYDVQHMLALCPTCHRRCTIGQIDQIAQRTYKKKLKDHPHSKDSLVSKSNFLDENGPVHFSWEDLKQIIGALHETVISSPRSENSKYDYSNIDVIRKNEINKLGSEYFQTITDDHEPYFHVILEFLRNPVNEDISSLYYEIVDELRTKIAAHRDQFERFEHILVNFADAAVRNDTHQLKGKRRVLNILLSFMYVNCDVGRKA